VRFAQVDRLRLPRRRWPPCAASRARRSATGSKAGRDGSSAAISSEARTAGCTPPIFPPGPPRSEERPSTHSRHARGEKKVSRRASPSATYSPSAAPQGREPDELHAVASASPVAAEWQCAPRHTIPAQAHGDLVDGMRLRTACNAVPGRQRAGAVAAAAPHDSLKRSRLRRKAAPRCLG